MNKKMILAVFTGLTVFAAIFAARLLVSHYFSQLPAFPLHLMFEVLLAVIPMAVAIRIFNMPVRTFSFRYGFVRKVAVRYSVIGLIMGMCATIFMLTLHVPPLPLFKQLQPPQLFITLLFASISEEILTRGLVQRIVTDHSPVITIKGTGISGGVLAGATVFSLIHFSIYIVGGSYITCIVIMVATFLLGIVAGIARERANLGAAILTHLSFNIGGIAAAILINIGSMLITGHLING